MKFSSLQESLAAAAAANAELKPIIRFGDSEYPARILGGKPLLRGTKKWGWYERLATSACSVPVGLGVSVLAQLTQQGLEAANFIREHYPHMTVRARPGDGAAEPVPHGMKKTGRRKGK